MLFVLNSGLVLFLKETTLDPHLDLELGVEMALRYIHRGNREVGDLQLTTLDSGLEGNTTLHHIR